MANYQPDRPRPSIDSSAALPGDASPVAEADSHTEELAENDSDSDPAPAPASRLLPRIAEPLDRRLLIAICGAAAVAGLAAVALAVWLVRRGRRAPVV